MPSKKYATLNSNSAEVLDTRTPLHPDEAFLLDDGIQFNCKFIGSMTIPRPTSRVEIVAAMRRVRFEFKQKGVKKKKVVMTISASQGIKTVLRSSRRRKSNGNNKKKNRLPHLPHINLLHKTTPEVVLEHHAIYRVFYVSHDSQDVKIFSYIARDNKKGGDARFKCCVFKAQKKLQALRIVRTVGQAFEVCHKINYDNDEEEEQEESVKETTTKKDDGEEKVVTKKEESPPPQIPMEEPPPPPKIESPPPPTTDNHSEEENLLQFSPPSKKLLTLPLKKETPKDLPHDNLQTHSMKLLKEKLQQQTSQTQAALAQVNLLRDQLKAESAARIEAQARTHQLLLHNKELLDHLSSLVQYVQDLERGKASVDDEDLVEHPHLPQLTPRSKIERWFQYAAMVNDDDDDEKKIKRNLSRGESGFVSMENNPSSKKVTKRRKRFLFGSPSHYFRNRRRVLVEESSALAFNQAFQSSSSVHKKQQQAVV